VARAGAKTTDIWTCIEVSLRTQTAVCIQITCNLVQAGKKQFLDRSRYQQHSVRNDATENHIRGKKNHGTSPCAAQIMRIG